MALEALFDIAWEDSEDNVVAEDGSTDLYNGSGIDGLAGLPFLVSAARPGMDRMADQHLTSTEVREATYSHGSSEDQSFQCSLRFLIPFLTAFG